MSLVIVTLVLLFCGAAALKVLIWAFIPNLAPGRTVLPNTP